MGKLFVALAVCYAVAIAIQMVCYTLSVKKERSAGAAQGRHPELAAQRA